MPKKFKRPEQVTRQKIAIMLLAGIFIAQILGMYMEKLTQTFILPDGTIYSHTKNILPLGDKGL